MIAAFSLTLLLLQVQLVEVENAIAWHSRDAHRNLMHLRGGQGGSQGLEEAFSSQFPSSRNENERTASNAEDSDFLLNRGQPQEPKIFDFPSHLGRNAQFKEFEDTFFKNASAGSGTRDFYRQIHEDIFPDANPIDYLDGDPTQQDILTRRLHDDLRRSGLAEPSSGKGSESESTSLGPTNKKIRRSEYAKTDEDQSAESDKLGENFGREFGFPTGGNMGENEENQEESQSFSRGDSEDMNLISNEVEPVGASVRPISTNGTDAQGKELAEARPTAKEEIHQGDGLVDDSPVFEDLLDEEDENQEAFPDDFELGDIVVPDMHNNVPEAVLLAHDEAYGGNRVFLRPGEHTWKAYNFGRIEVLRPLKVIAQRGATLLGKWLLLDGSSGEFKNVQCLWEAENSEQCRVIDDPTVYIQGGRPWKLKNCEIRSAGCISLTVSQSGQCEAKYCTFGGAGEITYVEAHDEKNCGSHGVNVMGKAEVSLQKCLIEDTYGPGCNFLGRTKGEIESCLFQRNGIGIAFDYRTNVEITECVLREIFEGAFWAMPGESKMEVRMTSNQVHGCVWCTNKRPEKLSIKGNNFNVSIFTCRPTKNELVLQETFPEQWKEVISSYAPMLHDMIACGQPWIQRDPPDGVKIAKGFAI
ncbi:hypothetical protein GUITHDRAFT_100019 [Guillardia theta CCMP2712]|uniref:Right handed beta helix domain-containing protein n=1 Tax=Guillardia theta (strain CCMP2712) TaxID=905079 RepID=L1K1T5_GUITC|nr:hypothetical protein GUITHDRAFT_100019 [Guillardia theta CCMP2712]EKX54544.1 hypothetical protein GUITHDRAFT_100019 [Guillardia theta CCMP2712]|eukprot:XP_005841524.1 hypothetical protein GUITHDRAFT_100019 [Guillardia theta CCMP2712]